MKAYAHESITVADTAIGFTAANIALANSLYGRTASVIITAETAQMRFTVDGTTPTTTVGHLLDIGDAWEFSEDEARKFSAIRTGASSGAVKATYEV